MKLKDIKPNPNNPRVIKDDKFQQLKNSINQSEGFGELSPIKVDRDMVIIGGNMRYRACQDLGIKDFPVIVFTTKLYDKIIASRIEKELKTASATYEDVSREFIIKDNVSFGEHDWDALANDWDSEDLNDWGLDVWQAPEDVDYSILDDEDETDSQLEDMAGGVKKAIQIEFEPDHYEDAVAIVKYWRERDAYIGKMILDFLTAERDK